MNNELIDRIDDMLDDDDPMRLHCRSAIEIHSLLLDCKAALQPSLQQDAEPENLSELLDSAMVSTGEIVPDKAAHPQDVEKWIEQNELVAAAGSEVNSVIKTSAIRAFLAGKVLVPAIELNDVLEMAGMALSMTPIGSRERESFSAVADALK